MINQRKNLFFLLISLLLMACGGAETAVFEKTLLVVEGQAAPNQHLSLYDTQTQHLTPLFSPPQFSQIYQATLNENGTSAIFSFSPPPAGGSGFFDRSGLYRLPLADAEPELILGGQTVGEYLLMPVVSGNGRYLFYTKQSTDPANSALFTVTLERYNLETKETHLVVYDGIWPRLSPDETQLVFIGVNPQTLERALVLTDLDGSFFEILVENGRFFDIDTPIFSPDGKWIYFSVATDTAVSSWDRILGVKTAYAHADHNIPSDWWRISVNGGEPEQLTFSRHIILHGVFDKNGNTLFYSTQKGLYALTPDNNQITIQEKPIFGTISLLP